MTSPEIPASADFSSFLTFAAPALVIIAIMLVVMLSTGDKKPGAANDASRGEAELLAEIRELKRRRALDKGGA